VKIPKAKQAPKAQTHEVANERKVTSAEFRLANTGHTSAVQIAVDYMRGHNRGVNVLEIPNKIVRALESTDGQYGPDFVKIYASAESDYATITAMTGGQILFYASFEPRGELPLSGPLPPSEWRVNFVQT
jgi:hypothetical protein